MIYAESISHGAQFAYPQYQTNKVILHMGMLGLFVTNLGMEASIFGEGENPLMHIHEEHNDISINYITSGP